MDTDRAGRCCETVENDFVSLKDDEGDESDPRVKWSSCVRRQADEQKAVPLVCLSQDKQKSPRRKSMFVSRWLSQVGCRRGRKSKCL